ncbi:hypothetical protein [Desulfonatronovibrio magnus]|uniref:hypothetical protein n=1 Tax=Desulfonatronovibrio magnus TaxID=698827 RepID=UPI0005EB9D7E|nr:hypothetical protein [Desulfonatronovibrio magnus]
MLVQNFVQVTSKSPEEIKAGLQPGIRALKIDPDAHGRERPKDQGRQQQKQERDEEQFFDAPDTVSTRSSNQGTYHVYNRNGQMTRLKVNGSS